MSHGHNLGPSNRIARGGAGRNGLAASRIRTSDVQPLQCDAEAVVEILYMCTCTTKIFELLYMKFIHL